MFSRVALLSRRPFPHLAGFLALSVGLLPALCHARAAKPRVFSVRQFGAAGDDTAKDTAAFQAALDAAGGQAGGGTVDVPPGLYLIGSVVLPAHVTLNVQVGANVLGSDDPADYPLIAGRWEGRMQTVRRALLAADHADGITITGQGLIQGGPTVGRGRDPRGPVLFEPVGCDGVRVSGVTVKNSGAPTLHPTFCADVTVSQVSFESTGDDSDGLALDSCRHVRVEGCAFSDGGDDIVLTSGTGREGQAVGRPCEDVSVTRCAFGGGQAGVEIGGAVAGGVRQVRVAHCTFKNLAGAVVIRAGGDGSVEDVSADELTVTGADVLRVAAAGPAALRDVRLSHVKAVRAKTLLDVAASPQSPLDGLTVSNVTGTYAQAMTIRNATHVALAHVFVRGYAGPRLVTENVSGTGLGGAAPYQGGL